MLILTIPVWMSVFLLWPNYVNAVECPEQTIRFVPAELLALSNCTAILGSLTIMAMDNADINDYHFPKLKEITGYLLLFHVLGLTSVGKLFPNLSVIRGNDLVLSYSLIIFSLPHLSEVGLKSLISIQRGYVIIERCPSLCYQNTIDWEALTDENEEDLGAGKGNVIMKPAPKCPTKESCRQCTNDNCWSSYHCQKNVTSHYVKGVNKCNDLCLGTCANKTAEGCYVCSKLRYNGKCVQECPSDLLLFRDTMRCITKEACLKQKLIPFLGECRKQCPDTYSKYNPETKQIHDNECFKCVIKCIKKCYGSEIRGASDLEYFRGCTIVEGSLSIKLGVNMTDINEKLEETLGNIEIINGVLRVYRSFSLTSLSFFRNLNKINADNATFYSRNNSVHHYPYALEITENDNLQTLFDWKEKLQFEITGGAMSFHFNAKLCMNEIHNLQDITTYNRTNDTIGYDTNGYDEICHATGIFVFHVVHSHSDVRIYWNISDFGANKKLIGYFVYYIEADVQNITYFSGLDACSTKKFGPSKKTDMPMIRKKASSDIWQSVFVPFEDLTSERGHFAMTITNLKQYTQYAYYVRTQLSLKVKDQMLNVTQGQSEVKYFRTLPDRPRPPIVRTQSKTNVTITLEWNPSTPERELVQKYMIDVYVIADDVDEIDKRNYCDYPRVNDEKKEDIIKTPELICCRDQKAYLEFFQRDSNETCGPSDPTCEMTYKFVLFHHHVENALLMADPSKPYQFDEESIESPAHHSGHPGPIIRKFGGHRGKFYLHSHIIDDKYMQSLRIPNLKPFTNYAFYVYACNKISNCSDYYFHSDRTLPYIYADEIAILVFPDENITENFASIIISQPFEPNGVIVSYEIETFYYNRNMMNVTCLTRKEMATMNYTVRFENLLPGTYSFRARCLSLGQDGPFSDWVFKRVKKVPHDVYKWGVSLSFITIFMIIVIGIVYQKWKTCRSQQVSETTFLLDEEEVNVPSASLPRPSRSSNPSPSPQVQERQASGTLEAIQMAVFKSNVKTSLDQYSTPSGICGGIYVSEMEQSQPATSVQQNPSLVRRIFKTLQKPPGRDRPQTDSEDIEMEEASMEQQLITSSPQRRRRLRSETNYEFPEFSL
ncbi:Insulin receptor-related protein [Pseudolycoriella hygida]|uniref:receptor protein-tyrosine kinase n=1 Tax=Pseudolycoriella hygida TaxID=35572 RepID=A0A9Q0SAJ0_9DIPT|nr:Insulin receptor-related protein [Pseudolycoriella hygida]